MSWWFASWGQAFDRSDRRIKSHTMRTLDGPVANLYKLWRILSLMSGMRDTSDFIRQSLRSSKFAITVGNTPGEFHKSLRSAHKIASCILGFARINISVSSKALKHINLCYLWITSTYICAGQEDSTSPGGRKGSNGSVQAFVGTAGWRERCGQCKEIFRRT